MEISQTKPKIQSQSANLTTEKTKLQGIPHHPSVASDLPKEQVSQLSTKKIEIVEGATPQFQNAVLDWTGDNAVLDWTGDIEHGESWLAQMILIHNQSIQSIQSETNTASENIDTLISIPSILAPAPSSQASLTPFIDIKKLSYPKFELSPSTENRVEASCSLNKDPTLKGLERTEIDITNKEIDSTRERELSQPKLEPESVSSLDIQTPNLKIPPNYTSFFESVKKGDLEAMLVIRSQIPDFDINQQNSEGFSCLDIAIINEKTNVALELLNDKDIDVNNKGPCNMTAIFLAIQFNNSTILKQLLLNPDISLSIVDIFGNTPLHAGALKDFRIDCTKLLLDDGRVNVNSLSNDGYSALHYAIMYGNIKTVEILANFSDVNIKDTNGGRTPLLYAIYINKLDCAMALLDNEKTDVNAKQLDKDDANYKWSILHYLMYLHPSPLVLKKMLERSELNVNALDKSGNTALIRSCQKYFNNVSCQESSKSIKMLIENEKTDVNIQNNAGKTALMQAAILAAPFKVSLLMDASDVNLQDNEGNTALHLSILSKADACTKLIINHPKKKDINIKNNRNHTPLTLAAKQGSLSIVKCLLKSQEINTLSMTRKGNTALHYAAMNGHLECLALLMDRSDINARNIFGATPLDLARNGHHVACVDLLKEKGGRKGIGKLGSKMTKFFSKKESK